MWLQGAVLYRHGCLSSQQSQQGITLSSHPPSLPPSFPSVAGDGEQPVQREQLLRGQLLLRCPLPPTTGEDPGGREGGNEGSEHRKRSGDAMIDDGNIY